MQLILLKSVRNTLKVSVLNKSEKEWVFQESVHEKFEVLRDGISRVRRRSGKKLRDIMKECTKDGMSRVGGQRRKWS